MYKFTIPVQSRYISITTRSCNLQIQLKWSIESKQLVAIATANEIPSYLFSYLEVTGSQLRLFRMT
jgi:hypothetical protein